FSQRIAGVLLPVSALPGEHPCGGLGRDARRFLHALAETGATVWQVLPLGPTRAAEGHSPYSARCTFSLATDLVTDGDLEDFIQRPAAEDPTPSPADSMRTRHDDVYAADRDHARRSSADALASTLARFQRSPERVAAWRAFCERERSWLLDAARFDALSTASKGNPWWTWDPAVRTRDHDALAAVDSQFAASIERYTFGQFVAHEIWAQTRAFANARGLRIMGDLPIYVHADGPDVWTQPELFDVDPQAGPTHFAGVPPDAFSATGQLWRNPTYRWAASAATDHAWWRRRVARHMELYDDLRLDHFRGFSAFWRVPATANDASSGAWTPGPSDALLRPIIDTFGADRFVAEDLGVIDAPVEALQASLGLAGTRVLQFAAESDSHRHVPNNWPARCVAYTGTHDNPTLSAWIEGLDDETRALLAQRLGVDVDTCDHDRLLAQTLDSPASIVVIPVADLLSLGPEGRINTPGVEAGNWRLRLRDDQIDRALSEVLAPALSRHDRGRCSPTPASP
ncbi:MAG: 4-alpha-glucanotransferase, partial [Nannocystaceae bacterium]